MCLSSTIHSIHRWRRWLSSSADNHRWDNPRSCRCGGHCRHDCPLLEKVCPTTCTSLLLFSYPLLCLSSQCMPTHYLGERLLSERNCQLVAICKVWVNTRPLFLWIIEFWIRFWLKLHSIWMPFPILGVWLEVNYSVIEFNFVSNLEAKSRFCPPFPLLWRWKLRSISSQLSDVWALDIFGFWFDYRERNSRFLFFSFCLFAKLFPNISVCTGNA